MKCKKCGHTAKTIGAMAAHYRKAHPGAMKPKGRRVKSKGKDSIFVRVVSEVSESEGKRLTEMLRAYYNV
jgi:hypothetical protein